jgi:formylglycine-generating enzyme
MGLHHRSGRFCENPNCGTSGNYTYSVIGSYGQAANCPVFDVSWCDAARFANWLQNGQPTGVEGPGTTETGAYTLNGATSSSDLAAITRNAGATYFIPSEGEWYKAAFYKGGSQNAGYWTYETQSNTVPSNAISPTGTNNANYNNGTRYTDRTNYLTPVGAFAASPGPYGTFDMGGNVLQWNEAKIGQYNRCLRGGAWYFYYDQLPSSYRFINWYPTPGQSTFGFRVASIPEPSGITLVVCGAIGLLAYAWRRRRA